MFDFFQFLETYGPVYGAVAIGGLILFYYVRRDLKALAAEYKLALKRIEVLEQSIKDSDRIVGRGECVQLLKSLQDKNEKAPHICCPIAHRDSYYR